MYLVTYLLRVIPQLVFVDWKFPGSFDRYLRYVAYALVVSIISTSLFVSGAQFEAVAAPRRSLALIIAIAVAMATRSTVTGMLTGTTVALLLS